MGPSSAPEQHTEKEHKSKNEKKENKSKKEKKKRTDDDKYREASDVTAEEHGLLRPTPRLEIPMDAIETVVRGYTREAGVRELERQLARARDVMHAPRRLGARRQRGGRVAAERAKGGGRAGVRRRRAAEV